jgi:hypothetical protein
MNGDFSLLGSQEVCCGCVERQVPESDERNEDSSRSFDDEEIAPWSEGTAVDLEDTEGEETGEGTSDGLSGVEDCESASEFASAVEPGVLLANERSLRGQKQKLT